jgi:hypothetical protein
MLSLNDSIVLLNPHGSDETIGAKSVKEDSYELLNPHGSDETFQLCITRC